MLYEKFIQPERKKIGEHEYMLSHFPALDSQPIYREVAKSVSENGVIGITMLPNNVIKEILRYVAFQGATDWIVLDTDLLINECIQNPKDLIEIVVSMVKLNFDFLVNGDLLSLLTDKVEATDFVS